MSLADGKPTFIEGLVALQQEMMTKEIDSFQEYAEQFAQLIEDFIKSAKVSTGISVTTMLVYYPHYFHKVYAR